MPTENTLETIVNGAGLTEIHDRFAQAIASGALPPTATPTQPYRHPTKRISADRTQDPLWLLALDASDYRRFGDTQATAPEGVLNPKSPFYGQRFVNYNPVTTPPRG